MEIEAVVSDSATRVPPVRDTAGEPAPAGWYEHDGQVAWWDGSTWASEVNPATPGWYDTDGQTRWWDGRRWTDDTPTQPTPPDRAATGAQPSSWWRAGPPWLLPVLAFCLGICGVLGVMTAVNLLRDDPSSPQRAAGDPVTVESVADLLCAPGTVENLKDVPHAASDQLCEPGRGTEDDVIWMTEYTAESETRTDTPILFGHPQYAIVPLASGRYLAVVASGPGMLQPLTDDLGVDVQDNDRPLAYDFDFD